MKQLIKLLDISHIREEVIESLTDVFVKSTFLTRACSKDTGTRSEYTGSLVHYYIYKCMENATLGFLYREYVMQKFDYDYCYVLKHLLV